MLARVGCLRSLRLADQAYLPVPPLAHVVLVRVHGHKPVSTPLQLAAEPLGDEPGLVAESDAANEWVGRRQRA